MMILGVRYDNVTVNEALKAFFQLLEDKPKANVFFLNADCLYRAQSDREYRDILDKADLVLPDGIGLKVATKIFGGRMKENCNGTDLSPMILEQAAKNKQKVFFLGGKEGIALKAAENAKVRYPSLIVSGVHSGYFNDPSQVIDGINASNPDILFVAMGVPLQEKWIVRHRDRLNPKVCIAVGAFLDYLSGSIPRAPVWMRRIHLEWFWRIFIDPKRLFKRYVIDGLGFVVYVFFKRLFKG